MSQRRKSRADRRRYESETPFPDRRTDTPREVEINMTIREKHLFIHFANALIAENCFAAFDRVLRAVRSAPPVEDVTLVFSKVPFIDSAAVGMLVELQKTLHHRKKNLIIANPTRQMKTLIDTLMLNEVFTIRKI